MSSTLTDLTAATTWSGTDLFYGLVGGNSRKIEASRAIVREETNVIASDLSQAGGSEGAMRLYRTGLGTSNYERLTLKHTSTSFDIACESGGSGASTHDLQLIPSANGRVKINGNANAAEQFIISGGAASGFINFHLVGTGRTYQLGVGNASESGYSVANKFFIYDRTGDRMRIICDSTGQIMLNSMEATPAGGSTGMRLVFGTTAGFGIYIGSGAPSVSAAQGSLYLNSTGSSSSTRLYVNSNGSTTWVAVTTAS